MKIQELIKILQDTEKTYNGFDIDIQIRSNSIKDGIIRDIEKTIEGLDISIKGDREDHRRITIY